MYKKSFSKNILLNIAPIGSAFIVFITQTNYEPQSMIFFILAYFLIFYTASELINLRSGVITSIFVTILQIFWAITHSGNSQTYFLVSAINILGLAYYLVVKNFSKNKLEKTTERERHFRTLVNVSLSPIIIKNEKGEILFASESLKSLLSIKNNLPKESKISQFIYPEDIHTYNNFLSQVLEWPNERQSVEIRLKKGEAEWIWVKADAVNLLSHNIVKAIVLSLQDVTSQKTLDFQKAELLKNEKAAREIAEKAVRDRDEFLSIASHELKTPLTTILLQLQATLRKIMTQSLSDFSGKDLLGSLQIAEKQSQSLSNLIKDLLNVSIASTGRLTLNKELVNLADIVDSLSKKYSEEIKLSGCNVKTVIFDKEILGHWDPVRLEQALANLLTNALKYAEGKDVTLSAEKNEKYAVFKIVDQGIGISSEMLTRIFEPFQRANGNSNVRGLGVGLFITKQIADSHGGTIGVESKLGKGTTFTLRLPL